jgi:pheromone shutdown protein TraB
MNAFWKNWIKVWCFNIILFGAVLAAGGLPATDGIVGTLFGILSSEPLPEGFLDAPGIRFSVALMGAVTMGWGLTILFLLPAIHAAGAPAWRGLTAALAIWFVIDGVLSAATGFPLNNLPNIALMAGYLAPLLASGAMKSRT